MEERQVMVCEMLKESNFYHLITFNVTELLIVHRLKSLSHSLGTVNGREIKNQDWCIQFMKMVDIIFIFIMKNLSQSYNHFQALRKDRE